MFRLRIMMTQEYWREVWKSFRESAREYNSLWEDVGETAGWIFVMSIGLWAGASFVSFVLTLVKRLA